MIFRLYLLKKKQVMQLKIMLECCITIEKNERMSGARSLGLEIDTKRRRVSALEE